MASTPKQIPGTHFHRLALTKIHSKHLLNNQMNKMVDSVFSNANSILAKLEHSKLNYHELLELFQGQMERSSEHYRQRLALEVELAHKNVIAAVMDSIYARFEESAKWGKKKIINMDAVARMPIGDSRESINQEQIPDFSLQSLLNEPQSKESSSSVAVRKQVCFPPNDEIFQYDETDSEDDENDDDQSQSMMDDLSSSIDSDEVGEQTNDGPENPDNQMQSKLVNNNMTPSLPQGEKRKSIDYQVKIEHDDPDVKIRRIQATFSVDNDYQFPMSENALGSSHQPKPTKPNGKGIEQLVKLAIESSPSKRLQIQDIYSYIHLNSPYYAQMDRWNSSWHLEIRRTISGKSGRKIFRGIPPVPGDKTQKSYYWTLLNA